MLEAGLIVCKNTMDEINFNPFENIEKIIKDQQYFSSEETKEIIHFYQYNNLMEYVREFHTQTQVIKIEEFLKKGLLCDLQFFLDKGTYLREKEI